MREYKEEALQRKKERFEKELQRARQSRQTLHTEILRFIAQRDTQMHGMSERAEQAQRALHGPTVIRKDSEENEAQTQWRE